MSTAVERSVDLHDLDAVVGFVEHAVKDVTAAQGVCRAEVFVEDVDMLAFLDAQAAQDRFYWADREGTEQVAGMGVADCFEGEPGPSYASLFRHVHRMTGDAPEGARYFGGLRFDLDGIADKAWSHFGDCRFILPRFEIKRNARGTTFSLQWNGRDPEDRKAALADAKALIAPSGIPGSVTPALTSRIDNPDQDEWSDAVDAILCSIDEGQLEKVVLARNCHLEFNDVLNPFDLLRRLRSSTSGCFHFCIAKGDQTAFLGASPERLYSRVGRSIKSEALAGTRPRGNSPIEDGRIAMSLMRSDKDLREHEYVVRAILESFAPLCDEVAADKDVSLLRLARSQHLLTSIAGTLHGDIGDGILLSRLHPTPAVGCYPNHVAFEEIGRREHFDRGWYAGPVGWVSAEAVDLIVAIRSGFVDANSMSLYSGAGIVAGSDPQAEWEEVEHKVGDFIKILTDD